MKSLTILAVLSFCALVWTATVPVDLTQNNTDSKLVSNIVVPADEASPNTVSSSKKARQTDTDVPLPSDEEDDDSVPVDQTQNNIDSKLVLNIVVPEGVAPPNTGSSSNKAPQTDTDVPLPSEEEDDDSDIYWRPWNGTLPKDALMGAFGVTQCGAEGPIYMAQVLHRENQPSILPTQLYKRSKFATVSYGHRTHKHTDNVMVLCAEDPNIVTWIPIADTFDVISDVETDCVVAGNELDFNTFFGRTVYEEETIIGKVLYKPRRMFFPYYNEEKSIGENFDVLCYTKPVEAKRIESLKLREQKKQQQELEYLTTTEGTIKKATTEARAEIVVTKSPPLDGYHAGTLRKWYQD